MAQVTIRYVMSEFSYVAVHQKRFKRTQIHISILEQMNGKWL